MHLGSKTSEKQGHKTAAYVEKKKLLPLKLKVLNNNISYIFHLYNYVNIINYQVLDIKEIKSIINELLIITEMIQVTNITSVLFYLLIFQQKE